MRTHLIARFALSAMLATVAVPATAAAAAATADEIVREAQRVRAEAQDIKQLLRASRPDLALVDQRMDTLEAHARALRDTIAAFDASALTPAQRAAFDQARVASETLQVMLANKAALLADADRAGRSRSLLRAKADGIARRAGIVETQMVRARG